MKCFIFIIIHLIFNFKVFADNRYICKQSKNTENSLVTNFYISNDKVYMSGVTGSGTYELMEKNKKGILAINVALIGKDYGIETVLIDKIKQLFYYKTSVSFNKVKKIVKLEGFCKSFK